MEDSNTIIGIKYDEEQNQNMLVKETLGAEKNQHYFFETSFNIRTLLLNEESNSIYIGTESGELIEIDLRINKRKVKKHYGNLNIGSIRSCTRFSNVGVFGGKSNLKIVEFNKQELLEVEIPSISIEGILSLQIADVHFDRALPLVLLIISGNFVDYSNQKTDVVDITKIIFPEMIPIQEKLAKISEIEVELEKSKAFLKEQRKKIDQSELKRLGSFNENKDIYFNALKEKRRNSLNESHLDEKLHLKNLEIMDLTNYINQQIKRNNRKFVFTSLILLITMLFFFGKSKVKKKEVKYFEFKSLMSTSDSVVVKKKKRSTKRIKYEI